MTFSYYPGCTLSTKAKALDYHNHLYTLFCLESMNNLARNGRVNIAVAKIAGMLGIHGKDAIYELLSERFGSCIYARGRY